MVLMSGWEEVSASAWGALYGGGSGKEITVRRHADAVFLALKRRDFVDTYRAVP